MTLRDLTLLKEAWRQQHPEHAGGGDLALRGFAFQFHATLLDVVRSWLDAGSKKNEPQVFSEILSDIAELRSDGVVVVTQVKLTQSSKALSGALDDLYRIYLVCKKSCPQLIPKIQFRVLSERAELVSVEASVRNWGRRSMHGEDANEFISKLSVALQCSPDADLMALLVNKMSCKSPVMKINQWLGLLVDASSDGLGYKAVSKYIWNDLVALEGEKLERKSNAIYAFTSGDFQPDRVVNGKVLTGQQPRVQHLREGYFAPRHEMRRSLMEKIREWSLKTAHSPDEALRLPLFWIAGRSGAGKSVAMLQVLGDLNESGGVIVLLLPGIAQLPNAIRWSTQMLGLDKRILIAIDDPYAPITLGESDSIWRDSLDELHAFRQAGETENIPLVVCCGPTEQGERLRNDMPDDVDVTLEEIGRDDDGAVEELRDWYLMRTGKRPPEMNGGNVLLVQLFFEWRVESTLPHFAMRLKKRIENADRSGVILRCLAEIMSLNRLYVGANKDAIESSLTPELKDLFSRLRAEQHLSDEGDSGREGLWLSHPHLAEAIYATWFPAEGANVRKSHLLSAIVGADHYGRNPVERTAPLWAIARVLDGDSRHSDLASRLDYSVAIAVLKEAHQHVFSRSDPQIALLPVWIKIFSVAPQIDLDSDPISYSIQRVNAADGDEQGLRLVCHKLLEIVQFDENHFHANQASSSVASLLQRYPSWHEWAAVAKHAIRCVKDERFIDLVVDHINENHRSKSAQYILLQLLKMNSGDQRIAHVAMSLLEQSPVSFEWAKIASLLMASSDQVRGKVLDWAEGRREQALIGPLLVALVADGHQSASDWCVDWLRRWYLSPHAEPVLHLLCVEGVTDEIVDYACSWIRRSYGRTGFLMVRVLQFAGNRVEVQSLGIQWLDTNPGSSGEWGHVWEAVARVSSDTGGLIARGLSWLDSPNFDHRSWPFIWEAIWKVSPNNQRLNNLGLAWLPQVSALRVGWASVLGTLLSAQIDSSSLIELGISRLDEVHGEKSWSSIWLILLKYAPHDVRLRSSGQLWLRSVEKSHVSWSYVWRPLWAVYLGDQELYELAVKWLHACDLDQSSYSYVWHDLWGWAGGEGDSQLAELGACWLISAPVDHKNWVQMHLALSKSANGMEASMSALNWLRMIPPENKSWAYVWRAECHIQSCSSGLCEVAEYWLDQLDVRSGMWQPIWKDALEKWPGEARFLACAARWLKRSDFSNPSWPYIWSHAWNLSGGHEMLFDVGRTQLADVRHVPAVWVKVWNDLWALSQKRELVDLACEWLEFNDYRVGRFNMISALLQRGDGDANILEIGKRWLNFYLPDRVCGTELWREIWRPLSSLYGVDKELCIIGEKWLLLYPSGSKFWTFVWQDLWSEYPGRNVLRTLAASWLNSVHPSHGSWSYIWMAVVNNSKFDSEFIGYAHNWLERAPEAHKGRRAVRKKIQELNRMNRQ